MCNYLLKPLIIRFRQGDSRVFSAIYDNFKKLIYYYSARLDYEDSSSELTVFLIELLENINLSRFRNDTSFAIKKYIAACIRNRYIAISQKKAKSLGDSLALYDSANPFFENYDDKILMNQALSVLSSKQKIVMVYKYVYGYSDFEIAHILGISRQAVNAIKNRALIYLREYLGF